MITYYLYYYIIATAGSLVKWSPSGDQYVVVVDSRIDVYIVQSAQVSSSADFYVRINDITFLEVGSITKFYTHW